jgi:hypothetical protein
MTISRRHLLTTVPLMGTAVFLGACSISTVNGVTTMTLNLNTLQAYATAAKNGVTTLLSVPVISTTLGAAQVEEINTVVADMAAQVAALNTANKGVATLTFSVSSVPAAVTAFESDSKSLMNDVVVVATSLVGSLAANIVTTVDALQTVLALGEAVSAVSVGAVKPKMSASQALKVLGA